MSNGGNMFAHCAAALLALFLILPAIFNAQDAPKDIALASTFEDPQLKWVSCPPFFPNRVLKNG
jgi:hypothetical protein